MMKRTMLALLLAGLLGLTACGNKPAAPADSAAEPVDSVDPAAAGDGDAQEITDAQDEEEVLPTQAAFAEADDNAVTFDDGDCSFVTVVNDDDTAVDGTVSVKDVDGNAMLCFTDDVTTADTLEDAVQKMLISVDALLAPEDIARVRSVEFDIYGAAKDTLFVNDNGENVKVPGWVGGGGGTICADENWYGFSDFSAAGINEYDLERSDACHVTFKVLLAASGKCWDGQSPANLQIMRWGMQNLNDTYIDNLTFFDEDGNSIPLTRTDASALTEDAEDAEAEDAEAEDAEAEDAPAEEDAEAEDAAEDAAES